MTFVKNAIAGSRKEVVIQENLRNNGASKMVESNLQTGTMESVQTVLLSDLYYEAKLTSKSENIFMKVDIEGFECEAFLQSQKGLPIVMNLNSDYSFFP